MYKFALKDEVEMEVGPKLWTGRVWQLNPHDGSVRIIWDHTERTGRDSIASTGWLRPSSVNHRCAIKKLASLVDPDEVEHDT